MEMSMWYIDSWAVLDGLAFASSRSNNEINAGSTVFLSVPDLEPIPVGRISTALRATRAGFQDGLLDPDGEEIGFETLDQVREAIRRGFLGGGLEPAAPAPPVPERPPEEGDDRTPEPPEGPPVDGGEYYEGRLSELGQQGTAWVDFSDLSEAGPRRALLQTLSRGRAVSGFYPYLRAFGEATLVEYAHQNRRALYHAGPMGVLLRWSAFLYSLGLWDGPGDFAEFLVAVGIDTVTRDLLREAIYFLPYSWASWSERAYPGALESLLFELPCPLRSHWGRSIKRLSDKLLLPLTDRQYFQGNRELPEFIPLLLCAMAIVADLPLVHWHVPRGQNADRRWLIERAFRWIEREQPGTELPWRVESLLSDYAWKRLEGVFPNDSSPDR